MLNLDSLPTNVFIPLDHAERELYEQIVPPDHFLRRLPAVVDFESFRPLLAPAYSKDQGRPPWDPVVVLKTLVLAFHYRLSDREVINAARFNVAQRLFLGLSLKSPLPHHTTLTYFRQRLGNERLQEVFDALVGQARQLGLVKDRLRLKDATHIIANVAVPSTIRLVAEVRDQLLEALQPFALARAAEAEQRAAAIRVASEDATDAERLLQRVTHLQVVLAWADDVPRQETFAQASDDRQEKLRAALALAHKVLADREDGAQDKVVSAHDADARHGKHGDFYTGYLIDVAMDADSEIITAVNVLPANGDEGGDAAYLITQEERAHGNDVESVSIDGAAYRGPVLRELTDPAGLNLEVFTPPSEPAPPKGFPSERFSLDVITGTTLTCPAGETTQQRERNKNDTGYKYRFSKKQCRDCPLRDECLASPTVKSRTVIKNDYEAEYAAAKAKAQTPEYAATRRRHPAIERKLAELVRRHDVRHARYRGCARVLLQSLLSGLVVNLKRIVRLLFVPPAAEGTVRAELAGVN